MLRAYVTAPKIAGDNVRFDVYPGNTPEVDAELRRTSRLGATALTGEDHSHSEIDGRSPLDTTAITDKTDKHPLSEKPLLGATVIKHKHHDTIKVPRDKYTSPGSCVTVACWVMTNHGGVVTELLPQSLSNKPKAIKRMVKQRAKFEKRREKRTPPER